MKRWWHYRRIHRMFGLKFWAMVVGAAPLDPDVEAFWGRLGFLVVQGYGLTETAPIVTLNHPFHARARRGRQADRRRRGADRGRRRDPRARRNVTTGYFNAPEETRSAFRDGWFHTGDIGELDDEGRLYIRGRKKEMIVTPEGLNVFPEDVERAINESPACANPRSSARPSPGIGANASRPMSSLAAGTDIDGVVRGANAAPPGPPEDPRGGGVAGQELPRTEGTRKLKRRELRDWLARSAGTARRRSGTVGDRAGAEASPPSSQRFAPGERSTPSTTIDELGLEFARARRADDGARGSAAGHGGRGAVRRRPDGRRSRSAWPVPSTPTPGVAVGGSSRADRFPFVEPIDRRPAALRRASLPTWILPLGRVFARVEVEGLEHLRDLRAR